MNQRPPNQREIASYGQRPAPSGGMEIVANGAVNANSQLTAVTVGVLSGASRDPSPMILFIGGENNIPAQQPATTGYAGAALVVEYGVGAASRTVRMDMRAGAYQLPSVQQCKVSLEIRASIAQTNFSFGACLVRGEAINVDVPRLTTRDLAGDVPSGARAVELASPGVLNIDLGGQVIESDWTVATPVFAPPYSPVRIAGRTYVFTPAAAYTEDTCISWLLSL